MKHSHYFKPVPTQTIDVYRVLKAFEVTDPCIQHAVKKLLVAGGRGAKDTARDVSEAIDTLTRWQAMQQEDQDDAITDLHVIAESRWPNTGNAVAGRAEEQRGGGMDTAGRTCCGNSRKPGWAICFDCPGVSDRP